MSKLKLFSIFPTLLLSFICLCAAAKNSGQLLLPGILINPVPGAVAKNPAEEFSHPQGYDEFFPAKEPSFTELITPPDEWDGTGEHEIRELTITDGASENQQSKVHFSNRTDYTIDINDYVAAKPKVSLKKTDEPQVLIVHTHATESYLSREASGIDGSTAKRSTSPDENMLAVGKRLISVLEEGGIACLHDTSLHDHPVYSGSYGRAADSIADYLKKYPSVKVVLDLHRDAVWKDDGTRLKPTVLVGEKKAAQIMIISGTDKGGLEFDTWRDNLALAASLQYAGDRKYPGLLRPLNIAAARYNMHFTSGSLLLEFGSDVNTLDEALYSAELMGEILLEVLLGD